MAEHGFARDVTAYPDSDAGVKIRGPMAMPVGRPAEVEAAPRPRRRKSPGDPSCEACQGSHGGYCQAHSDYHAEYDPLASLAGHRTAPAEDGRVRDWRPVR